MDDALVSSPFRLKGVDLVAPGVVDNAFIGSVAPNTYAAIPGATFASRGSSFAAPIAAGDAMLLGDEFSTLGWSAAYDARAMLVNMLVQSDGWSHFGSYTRTVGTDLVTGGGRLKMHYPSNENLVSPWGWGTRSFTINQGQTVSWPVGSGTALSSAITQWKWAVTWVESDLNNVADIDISVVDTCAGNAVIASQSDYDIRNRIRLTKSQLTGRCLMMNAYGYSVPSGGRTVYSNDFFHSGTPD